MAQTGFTPIQLYSSSTATNVPLAANLATGELAINITDGKLFYKDNAAAVQVIGWKTVPATAGGTGQTSYAVGDLLYANTTTTLAKLADVATGNALISGGVGVAPSYGKIGLTTHVSGTLPVANGGTNLTSFTANGVVYASSTSALATSSAFSFDGTNVSSTGSVTATTFIPTGTSAPTNGMYLYGTNATAFSSNSTYRGQFTSGGVFLVRSTAVNGSHPNANILRSAETTDGSGVLILENSNATNGTSIFVGVGAAGVGYNASICTLGVYRCNTNSRSINAAGSINASGADYAEYMTKSGDFAIAKGDVVGIDANGQLTNVFADAISFAVKSTDPSYVGGDTWGKEENLGITKPNAPTPNENDTEEEWQAKLDEYAPKKAEFDAALEAARQRVDRIAFAGQVPVNVIGAAAGQYIIPVNDNGAIKGEAVSNPTFEQYQLAVGKVIAIEADGRAKIIVKMA